MKNERHFTEYEKKQIYKIIHENPKEDDKDVAEVIKEHFGGDEEKYLITMAIYHGIKCNNALNVEQTKYKSIQSSRKIVEFKSKKIPLSRRSSTKKKADVIEE